MKVLIAGGGIGGLTAALCLHGVGIEVDVFEQAREVRELGVGINMLPHAVRELAVLGLLPALDRAGIRTRELVLANRLGQPVWRELRGIDAGYDLPQISIHRGRLQRILYAARAGSAWQQSDPYRTRAGGLQPDRTGRGGALPTSIGRRDDHSHG